MSLFRLLYSTFLDALFPHTAAEELVFSYSPSEAFERLPQAPKFQETNPEQNVFQNMQAIFAYKDERVSRLIWAIKYKKMNIAVQIGGYALFQTIKKIVSEKSFYKVLILPMPITKWRRRERGFNQCELLIDEIQALARQNDSNKNTSYIIDKNIITRIHHRSRQTLKDREDRLLGSKGIFAADKQAILDLLSRDSNLYSIPIIIIDDVITTGSTMREALDVLKKAGFTNVKGLAVAH